MISLANGLDRERFSPCLVVIGEEGARAGEIAPDVPVTYLHAKRLREGLPRLISLLRRSKVQCVVSTMGYVNLALLAAAPFIGKQTRLIVREANVIAATLRALPRVLPGKWLYRFLYPRADAVIVQSEGIASDLAAVAPGVKKKLAIVPNPVNEERQRARVRPGSRPAPGLTLVAAGRLTHQKGFDRLIDLMPLLPDDAQLTIYGEGPERAVLEAQIASLGLTGRVALAGFSNDLPTAIALADVFVLPSRWEGLPNVALEALALGTPVVASDTAGVEEIARSAQAEAMTVAPIGAQFVHALQSRRRPRNAEDAGLRPSLLPQRYRSDVVVAQFEDLLRRLDAQSSQ